MLALWRADVAHHLAHAAVLYETVVQPVVQRLEDLRETAIKELDPQLALARPRAPVVLEDLIMEAAYRLEVPSSNGVDVAQLDLAHEQLCACLPGPWRQFGQRPQLGERRQRLGMPSHPCTRRRATRWRRWRRR